MDTNTLTAAALAAQRAAPGGSLERKAAGCAAVVLTDARTVTGARKMLTASNLTDEVRDAALDLITALTQGEHDE